MTLYIQQIDIDNFKSFSGKTTIPFQMGFTTVSGPNGSGKSNIIDSILFCLGLSTSRTLRAEKLTDLINHSSRRREASVTITFGDPENPNMAKFVVTRMVKDTRQSGYNSVYQLNGKTTTLSEIQDQLSRYNISPHAYNVLMQGDVTGIINMSALERRRIIDEVAGVSEFDRKIEQAEREIEATAQGIERNGILRDELVIRVDALKADREVALKYQALREQKVKLEGEITLARYIDIQNRLTHLRQSIREAEQEKQAVKKAEKELAGKITAADETLQALNTEIKRKGEDQQIALKKQIEGLKGAVARKEDAIRYGKQKMIENAGHIKTAAEEITKLQSKQSEIDAVIEGLSGQIKALDTQLEIEDEKLKALNTRLFAMDSESAELLEKQREQRKVVNTVTDELSAKKRQVADVQAEIDRINRDNDFSGGQLQEKQSRLEEVNQAIEKLDATLKISKKEQEAFQSQVEREQLNLSKARVALTEASATFNEKSQQYNRLQAQKRAYDDVGLGRSVDTVLNAGIKGVHATLGQLISVEDDMAQAIEIALGARMRAIVVDTDRAAQDGVELLKRTQAGRATFLPLNKMQPPRNLPRLPEDDAILGFAIDLVQFDSKYHAAIAFACGDTVLVESMDSARRYIGQFRMVTLDGALFEKTGAITGGATQKQSGGGMLMSNKIEAELQQLEKTLAQAEENRNRAENQLAKQEIKLDTLKQDFQKFQMELQSQTFSQQALQREHQDLKTWLDKFSQDNAQGSSQIKSQQDILSKLMPEITKLEKELASQATALEEMEKALPTSDLTALKQEQIEIEKVVRERESELRAVENEMQSKKLEKEFSKKGAESHQNQIESLKLSTANIEKEAATLNEEILVIGQQIDDLLKQASQMDEELVALQAKRDEQQAALIELEREKFVMTQKMQSIDEQQLSYQAREKELRPELAECKAQLLEEGHTEETLAEAKITESMEEIQKTLQSIQKKMDAMGDVNMRAIADYDAVQERLAELSEKLETLSREKNDLQVRIQGYAELKRKTFMDAFDIVNKNFQEIFADLSDGDGQLILTNSANPFDGGLAIEARPRGKKTLRIESMSGGEKSLTALAFVFAFQRHMPAPFYAFDEVDMFLDGINAEKLAHMVKKQSNGVQFIVVSLRKPMIQNSDLTVGVTQKRDGFTKVTGVALRNAS